MARIINASAVRAINPFFFFLICNFVVIIFVSFYPNAWKIFVASKDNIIKPKRVTSIINNALNDNAAFLFFIFIIFNS